MRNRKAPKKGKRQQHEAQTNSTAFDQKKKQIVLQNDTLVAAIINVHYFYTLPQLLLLLLWFSSFCRQQCRKTETAIIHTIRHTQTHGSVPPLPAPKSSCWIVVLKNQTFCVLIYYLISFSLTHFHFVFSFLGQILWQRREKRGRWRRWWWWWKE